MSFGSVAWLAFLSVPGERARAGHPWGASAEDVQHQLGLRPRPVRCGSREDEGVPPNREQQARLQGGSGDLIVAKLVTERNFAEASQCFFFPIDGRGYGAQASYAGSSEANGV